MKAKFSAEEIMISDKLFNKICTVFEYFSISGSKYPVQFSLDYF